MSNYTPGPWTVIGKQGTAIWAGNEIIAQSSFPRAAPKVAHANSVLMAAAPEMLEALKLAYEAMNYMGDVLNGMDAVDPADEEKTTPAFNAVRAAIEKATGAKS